MRFLFNSLGYRAQPGIDFHSLVEDPIPFHLIKRWSVAGVVVASKVSEPIRGYPISRKREVFGAVAAAQILQIIEWCGLRQWLLMVYNGIRWHLMGQLSTHQGRAPVAKAVFIGKALISATVAGRAFFGS